MTDSDISKKYLTRLLNVKVTDEGIINNYIKEVMTKRALESLIMTELTCSALGAILESRSVREHESPTEERSHVRLHKEIDSYLLAVTLLVKGDDLMEKVVTDPGVIDSFVTAYEVAKLSGCISLEAQCSSRVGTAYLKLNLRKDAKVFFGLCLGLCAPTEANSQRYADKEEFNKAQIDLYKTDWFKEAVEGKGMLSTEVWIADEERKAQIEREANAMIAEASRLIHKAAEGTPVAAGVTLVRYIWEKHPPKGQGLHQEKIDLISDKISAHKGPRGNALLREVLKPMKFLYHPDRNLGLNSAIGEDINWKLICLEISKALNKFNSAQENAEAKRACCKC